jgi:hypothetical protein
MICKLANMFAKLTMCCELQSTLDKLCAMNYSLQFMDLEYFETMNHLFSLFYSIRVSGKFQSKILPNYYRSKLIKFVFLLHKSTVISCPTNYLYTVLLDDNISSSKFVKFVLSDFKTAVLVEDLCFAI